MSLCRNLATNLKTIRSFQNKTIAGFSEALGIGRSTLQELEAEKGNPTLATVSLMEANLDLPPGALLSSGAGTPLPQLTAVRLLICSSPILFNLPPAKRRRPGELLCEILAILSAEAGEPIGAGERP